MWRHLRLMWWLLWHPAFVKQYDNAIGLLWHPIRPAVQYAVAKVAADPSFHATKDHARKRAEALEWIGHSAREGWHDYQGPVPAWVTSFLLEWEIGIRKGQL